MGILMFLVFGLVVGLIARAIMPGNQSMGILATALLGIAGSFVGGFLASLVYGRSAADLHATGLVGAIIGSLVLLFIAGLVNSRWSRG